VQPLEFCDSGANVFKVSKYIQPERTSR
jgi:hypothetical protein